MDKFKANIKEYARIAWNAIKEWFHRFWVLLRRNWKKFHVTKVGILVILVMGLFLTVTGTIGARQEDVHKLRAGLENATTIIDDQGEEAGTLLSQKGTFIALEDMSPNIRHAVVSTEDRRFLSHPGFDLMGIGRAAVGLVVNREIVGGGSTITQQLAKNAYLTADQTFTRKLKELFLSIEIEKEYTKEEILEMYLNNSYFGQGVWGVQDASLKYFYKNASDLNLSEAATLAAALKAPSYYNPLDNYEATIERRNLVLSLMVETGSITEEERQVATAEDLYLADGYDFRHDYRYPYYFDAVIKEAENLYDFDEQDILNGGYTIYTNLNQAQQQQMTAVYNNDALFESASDGELAQSASIGINPRTGGITSVIGGRGDYNFQDLNRATQMTRRPGSIIKPLSVYAPALEAGYKIDAVLKDDDRSYGEGEAAYSTENVDFVYDGEVPMYEALAVSKNAATVWLLDQIGIKRGEKKLAEFGIELTDADVGKLGAIGLGALDPGVTPLEMASAYTVFANDGVRVEPHFITKIVDPTGAVVVNNSNPKEKRVLSKSVNDDMNRMLLYSISNGYGSTLQPAGYEIAGKTGTTETENDVGIADQWAVAYTPDLVVASWQGYDYTNEEDYYLKGISSQGISQVVRHELAGMLPYTEQTYFAVDESEIEVVVNDNTENEFSERLQEGVRKTEEVIRKTGRKAVNEAKKLLDSFLRNR